MAKKKTNKQPWSSSLESREALYKGVNPSADFDPLSIATQTIGYLGGFRTGHGMPEDEARWAAYLGLPYDKTYAPDTKIRFEGDEEYPDRQYQGLSKRAKNEVRKKIIPQAKRIKDKYNKEWIQVLDTKPDSEYNDATIYHSRQNYLGDLGKFGIREVGESGIYEVGDKYDFPALIPIPNRNEGTELMVRDTIWSDRANPKLYNQEVMKRKNKFYDGGLKVEMPDFSNLKLEAPKLTGGLKSTISTLGNKIGGVLGSALGGISGGIANTAATAIGGALAGGRTTGVGNALQGIGSLASNIPGVGGLIGAGVNLIGGGVNALFGSKLNEENIATVEGDIKQALNFTSNAGNYDALASNYAGLQGVMGFDKDFIGKDSWLGKKRAKRKFNSLKEQAEEAEAHQLLALTNNAQNIADTNFQLLEANYSAYGGPIDMKYTGVMSPFGNQFKDGGIYIKPSKRGTFTAAAKKRGMGVQEFASKVLANKEDYSPAMVKKANFARNASKWHDDGGPLGEENLSLEDFITQKINEKRAAALDKSRNRTEPVLPIINGIPNRNSCIYTATDNYGKKYRVPGNWTFYENPEKYGFTPVDINDAQAGDIIQVLDKGAPYHAMILDGYDEQGRPLYNYSRGSRGDSSDIVKSSTNFPNTEKLAYTFIGTPADSTQWINEYKEMYNKKADGGNLFTNGVTTIGNGGTHESNPYEGVQMGVDPQGIPNLVEEGEVIYDDYVFSNRLRVPKEVKQKYKLRGVTFADAAKQLQKESEERPNDPISKRGLNAAMVMLQQEQETVRMKKESNKYANGGRVNKYDNGSWLRYAPIAGHAIGAFSDLFSSPDYSAADTIEAVDITPATIGYTPVGNYLSYKPFDRDYYLNKLNADVAASRRAVTNTSGGNRAAAMAGLLAADYNYGNQLGTLARQAEEYNQALRERVEGFNRQTNLANAEMGLKAAMANAESRNQATKLRLSQAGQVAAMRKAAKDAYDARRSNNINVLLEELGGLGTENWNRDWLDRLAKAGVLKIDSKGNPVISSAK